MDRPTPEDPDTLLTPEFFAAFAALDRSTPDLSVPASLASDHSLHPSSSLASSPPTHPSEPHTQPLPNNPIASTSPTPTAVQNKSSNSDKRVSQSAPASGSNSKRQSTVSYEGFRVDPEDERELPPPPVLPWLQDEKKGKQRHSQCSSTPSSRASIDTTGTKNTMCTATGFSNGSNLAGFHTVKRYVPADAHVKRRQRWTAQKWCLLATNTVVCDKKEEQCTAVLSRVKHGMCNSEVLMKRLVAYHCSYFAMV